MPMLPARPNLFPEDLFEGTGPEEMARRLWWVMHIRPRQEKKLAEQLLDRRVPFYLPLISQRRKFKGRTQTSHMPLFPGYLFPLVDSEERVTVLSTNRVVRSLPVADQEGMWRDLRQVHRLIATGAPITPEQRLLPGMSVEIQSGPLAGLKGKIIRTSSGRRFVVQVNFIQQGASILLEDYILARVD